MDRTPIVSVPNIPRSCRLVPSGLFRENRERYIAQSKLTKDGQRAELPSLGYARIVNRGEPHGES
jgi:hypothetical protein